MRRKPEKPEPFDIPGALGRLPEGAGVYRFYSARGELLYVGKAKSLKHRVRNYFQPGARHSPKNQVLVGRIHRFDTVVTDNEIEALILEDNLIKAHRPPFNILMRDDKRYPWLCITDEPFPRLIVTRTVNRRGKARFFGPYSNTGALYETLRILRKHFPMRQRRKPLFRDRPCMNFTIGTCPGPCQNLIDAADYDRTVRQVTLFLKGRTDDLLTLIDREMREAGEALNFEWAAKLRDRHRAVQDVMAHRQKVFLEDDTLNLDVIGATSDARCCCAVVLKIRRGRLIISQTHELPLPDGTSVDEAYGDFLFRYYGDLDADEIPDALVLQSPLSDPEQEALLIAWLSQRRQQAGAGKRRVAVTIPRKGAKWELLAMARENAREAVAQSKLHEAGRLARDPARALMDLQEALDLPDYPARMECYDISHVQGAQTVASCVVFTDGRPDKAAYRRFKIRSAEGKPDDFKSMAEVIRRRFGHRPEKSDQQSDEQSDEAGWEDPDLVIVDGGKGQLQAALRALKEAGIENQPIIALAKRFEEVFLPGDSRPRILPRDSAALFLLQQIRDEAHRFAVTYHRTLRRKAGKASWLDKVPGVGERTKAKLLEHFGSVAKLRQASLDDLKALGIPNNTAQELKARLENPAPSP